MKNFITAALLICLLFCVCIEKSNSLKKFGLRKFKTTTKSLSLKIQNQSKK